MTREPASPDSLRPETLAAQALGRLDPGTRAVVPALHASTTFARDANYELPRHGYARDQNPNYDTVEDLLTTLERGAGCWLFSSGMAAVTAVFQCLAPGDHVVLPDRLFWGVRSWIGSFAKPWGLLVDYVPTGDMEELARAMQPGRTKLVWVETPANPTWEITSLARAAEIAHAAGARLAVDGTVATPVLTRPIEHGADLVIHSATKYLNGHSDLIAGAVVAARKDEFTERLARLRHDAGALLGSFEAWLLLRGMRTLYPRVRASCANAAAIAAFLAGEPRVKAVLYPGLTSHPGHEVARGQMEGGFGGMLSFRVEGGRAAALAVVARLELIHPATSLGGVESLIEHRATTEGDQSPTPDDLLRLSCGIEATEDLIGDLRRALA